MLDTMRRHSKNWIVKFFLALIIFVFIFYFGTSNGSKKADLVAEVGDIPISYSSYLEAHQRLLEFYRKQLGDKFDNEMAKKMGLKQKALDMIIEEAIVLKKTSAMDIAVSDAEVEQIIMSNPAFQSKDGKFDEKAFGKMLEYNRMNPTDYLKLMAKQLLSRKLASVLQSGIKVSPNELMDIHQMDNLRLNVEFAKVLYNDAERKISPTQADLENYLASNAKDFRTAERYKVRYIAFMGKNYESQVKLTNDDIVNHYERFKDKFKRSKSDKVAPPLSAVRGKVEADIKAINGMYSASDVAKKAYDAIYQQESIEKYAQSKGISLQVTDWFEASNLPKQFSNVKDFDKTVFSLQANTGGKIVSDDKGYYIVALAERKSSSLPPLSSVKVELEKRYKKSAAVNVCEKQANEILLQLKSGKQFPEVAKQYGIRIEETGTFSMNAGKAPKIGASKELMEALYGLSKINLYADKPIPVADGFAIIRFKSREVAKKGEQIRNADELQKALFVIKGRETLGYWLKAVKVQMEKDGTLKYHKKIDEL
ncbi:MAG: SurA N-terminal domain-containing protein [Deltaproteobacteria bacterium]